MALDKCIIFQTSLSDDDHHDDNDDIDDDGDDDDNDYDEGDDAHPGVDGLDQPGSALHPGRVQGQTIHRL